jgi:transposase
MNGVSPRINFSDEQYTEVEDRIRKTKARKLVDRLRVVLYKADGHSHKFIAKLVQLGRNQVTKVLQRFNQGGLTALLQPDNYQGSQAKLTVEQQ